MSTATTSSVAQDREPGSAPQAKHQSATLYHHPLVWRTSLPTAGMLVLTLYLIVIAIACFAPAEPRHMWTLQQIRAANFAINGAGLVLCGFLVLLQLRYPLGEQTWRSHVKVFALNFAIFGLVFSTSLVFTWLLHLRMAASLSPDEVHRMTLVHGPYGYWTCQQDIDLDELKRMKPVIESDLRVFGLETNIQRILKEKELLFLYSDCPMGEKSLPMWRIESDSMFASSQKGSMSKYIQNAFVDRLQAMAQAHRDARDLKAGRPPRLFLILAETLIVAAAVAVISIPQAQRKRLHPLLSSAPWLRWYPQEGTLPRLLGLARIERPLLLHWPNVWILTPHRTFIFMLASFVLLRFLPSKYEDEVKFLMLCLMIFLIFHCIVRQVRYKVSIRNLFFWLGYTLLLQFIGSFMLMVLFEKSEKLLSNELALWMMLVVPFAVAAILANAMDAFRAVGTWLIGHAVLLPFLIWAMGEDYAKHILAVWLGCSLLVLASLLLKRSVGRFIYFLAVAVTTSACSAQIACWDIYVDWLARPRGMSQLETLGAVMLLGGMLLILGASVHLLLHERLRPRRG